MGTKYKAKKGVVVGVDVSKKFLDVHCLPQADAARFKVSDLPMAVEWIREKRPSLVVIESSGGYEAATWKALEEAGIAVALVNPLHVRNFARSSGQYAKNDRTDARVLAEYGIALKPRVTQYWKDPLLRELLSRYAAIVEHLTAEKNRLQQAGEELIRELIRESIGNADAQQERVVSLITNRLAASDANKRSVEVLQSVPGVGKWTAMALVILLPELGTLSRRKIAKLAGLAPFTRESGDWKGKRFIGLGRAAVRATLYMPTVSAIRHNPIIREFYKHLVATGKPKMVAVTACMRKLLTILNAMVRSNTTWQPPVNAAASETLGSAAK